MSRQPRFEVVRSDAGWFARFIAANGKEVWRTSETYARRAGALTAVEMFGERRRVTLGVDSRYRMRMNGNQVLEVRLVDERTTTWARSVACGVRRDDARGVR